MPPMLYNCRTRSVFKNKEDQKVELKKRDNVIQKIRYWRKVYNYDLINDDYDEFNSHVKLIRKIHKIHDFVINYNYNKKTINACDLELYSKNYDAIMLVLPIMKYLKTLKKIRIVDSTDKC